jgi:2-phosphosulfolactate phosphatase
MPHAVRVYLAPGLFEPEDLIGAAAVVIDQLRASSTICSALGAGAAAVVPCEEVAEARDRARASPGSLLGGERAGQRLEGFDLGNSPAEFTPERVRGRTIVFTTTNGTRALLRARRADPVVLGSLLNREAVARAVAAARRPAALICAGIRGGLCAEDVLAAGAIAGRLRELGLGVEDDAARLAIEAWERVAPARASLLAALHASQGGRNLASIGLESDVEATARLDAIDLVPVLDSRGLLVPLAR